MKKTTTTLMLTLLVTLSFATFAAAAAHFPDPTDPSLHWNVTYELPGLADYCDANPKAKIYVIFEGDNGKTIKVLNEAGSEDLTVSDAFADMLDGVANPLKPLTGLYRVIDVSSGRPVVIGEVYGSVHIEINIRPLDIHILIHVEWKSLKTADQDDESATWGGMKALYN